MRAFGFHPARRGLAAVTLAAGLGACAVQPPQTATHDLDPPAAVSAPASRGQAYALPANGAAVCPGPGADATYDAGRRGDISASLVSLGNDSGSVRDAETAEELEMLGRTPAVLLARTLLFRLCLAGHNRQLSDKQFTDLYKRNLSIIEKVAAKEAGKLSIEQTMTLKDTQTVQPGTPKPAKTE